MIWPADVSAWQEDLTSATGQVEGMMILAGMALWYGRPAALPDKMLTT